MPPALAYIALAVIDFSQAFLFLQQGPFRLLSKHFYFFVAVRQRLHYL
jgi:hypothetical protein